MNMRDVKATNKANGNHFFDPGTMDYWHSKIETGVIGGRYFITSENQFHDDQPREFRVRRVIDGGKCIETVSGPHDSLDEAKAALLKGLTPCSTQP